MEIAVAENWINKYQGLLNGLEFEHTEKKIVSLSLLHLSLEHNQGIINLIKSNLHGSASALLRPQRDAFLRGIWMFRCASAEQVKKLMSGKEPPGIKDQLRDVEQTDGYRHGQFSSKMGEIKNFLHDSTHGGLYQSASRDKGNRIAGGYKEKEMDWLMRLTLMLSFLTCLEVCHIFNDTTRAHELTDVFNNIIKSNS